MSKLYFNSFVSFAQIPEGHAFCVQSLLTSFFEEKHGSHLRLGGLHIRQQEVMDLMAIATEYQATEKVESLDLSQNGFFDENAGCLINLLFRLPYLKEFDLSKNCFSLEAIRRFEQHCHTIEGVTEVERSDEQIISVYSDDHLRLAINLSKQQSIGHFDNKLQGELTYKREDLLDENLTRDKAQLQIQLEGDDSDRMEFERNKGGLQTKVDTLQAQVEALKKAVSNADRSNEQIQLEHHSPAAKFREMADKVYSLMDTLRLNQVDLKKRETQNKGQDKKLAAMEKHVNNVNAKLTMEKDATDIAAEETQRVEKIADEKRRQTRKTEEQITSIQKQQEKLERDAQEMAEKVAILQQQNRHFSNKVDGQEEDKNSLKIELQSVAEKCTAIQKTNAEIAEEVESQQAVLQVCKETYNKLQGELTYMKREDLLDENGRKRPILIQANDSNLLERLRINEFLYEAQQQRNPVPMLVEKVAVLLELIHTAQSQADQYLGDLSKSNGLAIALRQKNVALFESVSMFEAFKTQAVIKFIRNFFEAGHCSHLRLDGLYVTEHEVMDLMAIATEYQATEKVQSVNLADCGFLDENAGCLINLLFGLPYLKEFDLSKNCFSLEAIRRFEQQCRTMEGVTNVMRSAEQIISVHSGNQLRLAINLSDQKSPDTRPVHFYLLVIICRLSISNLFIFCILFIARPTRCLIWYKKM